MLYILRVSNLLFSQFTANCCISTLYHQPEKVCAMACSVQKGTELPCRICHAFGALASGFNLLLSPNPGYCLRMGAKELASHESGTSFLGWRRSSRSYYCSFPATSHALRVALLGGPAHEQYASFFSSPYALFSGMNYIVVQI